MKLFFCGLNGYHSAMVSSHDVVTKPWLLFVSHVFMTRFLYWVEVASVNRDSCQMFSSFSLHPADDHGYDDNCINSIIDLTHNE